MALVDLISILPSLTLLSSTFKILRVFQLMKVLRMMRALRVFRIFKTVGYGDIYPVTVIGKIVAMIFSVFTIAVVALPSGIITAGYLDKIQSQKEN